MRRFYVRRPRTPSLLPYARGAGCPSIRAKALSRTNLSWRCVSTARCAREGEDQDSGNLTRNHYEVELRSTNHRFGHDLGHDSSMRTSRRVRDARAPNQRFDLARADPGHRAGKGQINERPTRKPKPKRRSWVTIKRLTMPPSTRTVTEYLLMGRTLSPPIAMSTVVGTGSCLTAVERG